MNNLLWVSKKSEVNALDKGRIKIDAYLKLMGIQYEENEDMIGFLHQKIHSDLVFIEKKCPDGGFLLLPIDFSVLSSMTAEEANSYIEDKLIRTENDFNAIKIGCLQPA